MDIDPKDLCIFFVSERGKDLSQRIQDYYPDSRACLLTKKEVEESWNKHKYLLFICSCGIVVRMIAPLIGHKTRDPGVVVLDEWGRNCISLLSGHIGGANELAIEISQKLGARPILSTATDLSGLLGIDLWAKANQLVIENSEEIKRVSQKLLSTGYISVFLEDISLAMPDYYIQTKQREKADVIVSFKTDYNLGLILRPKVLHVGMGFNTKTKAERLYECLKTVFDSYNLSILSIKNIATLDKKEDDLNFQEFLKKYSFSARYFGIQELNTIPLERSEKVHRYVGAYGVCEPACILSSNMGKLLVKKQRFGDVTLAVAIENMGVTGEKGSLWVVGIGPGDESYLIPKAKKAILEADWVIGYEKYLKQIKQLLVGKELYSTGMTGEVKRCKKAIELAIEGKKVAIISGGDPNIYGMAGLVLELLSREYPSALERIDFFVIPGISALNVASALLGGALMHDFASISLSDRLTPWETIEKRLKHCAMADMVIVLYNPRSKGRPDHLEKALKIIQEFRPPDTSIGIVKAATRQNETVKVTTLGAVDCDEIDMETTLIIGNKSSFIWQGYLITPRGYEV